MRRNVSGLSAKEIQGQFGCSRTTAWRAAKSGWLCPGYQRREIIQDVKADIDWNDMIAETKRLAAMLTKTVGARSLREDLAQEFLTRLVELSGHTEFQVKAWRSAVCRHVFWDTLKKHRRLWRELKFPEDI